MLNEDEKTRLRYEEIYRDEVRREMSLSALSTGSRLWHFINSAFGLWLLSTVIIGGAVWAYAKWDNARNLEDIRRVSIRKLDIEISARLHSYSERSKSVDSSNSDVGDVVMEIREGPKVTLVFPEFKDRGLVSLLWELEALLEDDTQQAAVYKAHTIFRWALKENAVTNNLRLANLILLVQEERTEWIDDRDGLSGISRVFESLEAFNKTMQQELSKELSVESSQQND